MLPAKRHRKVTRTIQRKKPRFEDDTPRVRQPDPSDYEEDGIIQLPTEILFDILLRTRSPGDIIHASFACRLFYSITKDERLWKALFHRLSGGRPPMTRHHERYGKTWKWLAVVESLDRTWSRKEARMCGVVAHSNANEYNVSPFYQTWYLGDCILDEEDDYGERRVLLHGYGYTYSHGTKSIEDATPRDIDEGLWWRGELVESFEEMPESEHDRPDLNKPFDPQATADGTGYATICSNMDFTSHSAFYKGEWKDGKPHGRGRAKSDIDGNAYEGEWRNGRYHGQGVETRQYTTSTRTFFEGVREDHNGKIVNVRWSKNIPSTCARVWFADGRVYQGRIKDNDLSRTCGKGEMEYPDGSIYAGGFFNGKRHGHNGSLYFNSPDWRRYTGAFFNDLFQDKKAKLRFADGSRVTGAWYEGVFDATKEHRIKHTKGPVEPPHTCAACRFVESHKETTPSSS